MEIPLGRIECQIFIFAPRMEEQQSFDDYLINKKIDAGKFSKEDGPLYHELKDLFDQMHPDSFTAQKLFLINPIRRKFQLQPERQPSGDNAKIKVRPKIKK